MRRTGFALTAMAALIGVAACATDQATSESDEVVVTGSAGDDAAPPESPPPPPPPPPPAAAPSDAMAEAPREKAAPDGIAPGPEPDTPETPLPQSGTLTAGDYDDVLNPGLYKAYLDDALQGPLGRKNLPFVDATDRIELVLTDRLGKPMPFAEILVQDSDGHTMFPLTTGAKGRVFLYPQFDALGETVTLKATAPEARAISRTLDLSGNDTPERVTLSFKTDASKVEKLDLLLTIDAIGSMSDEMRYLQSELLAILDRVRESQGGLDIHAGLIVYRDTGDQYVVRDFDFTADLDAFMEDLKAQKANGGGDFPEAMQDAMKAGLGFDWREDAVKVNMLVADAPPHDEDIQATWDSALYSRTRGIHIVPLAASGVDDTAEFLMRAMSQITDGRYLFLTDDSGVGNPHAEPTVDCYVVTRLDSLVERVLTELVTGQRIEPDGDEVIRVVGDYKAGICKVDEAES
ncbi:vWA domain-containing protein [Henriciella aquimarina]|uniref:VWA domain-containing protein n=1 Tax=Henriciella aquimarina TaxID=545261 RepID=UPI00117B88BD|nr:VWA domain-containing protein [Henriciella aquimarina]